MPWVAFFRHQVHARFYRGLLVALRKQRLLDGSNDFRIGQGQRLHVQVVQIGQVDFGCAVGHGAVRVGTMAYQFNC